MQLVLFIIYFWSWDTVRAVYDLCVTGDPMTPNDLCFSFKRNILSFTFILITLLSIKTVDYIRPSRFVVDVWIGIITALAPFDPGSYICAGVKTWNSITIPVQLSTTTVDNGYIEHAGENFWGSIYPLFDIYVDPFQRIYRIF